MQGVLNATEVRRDWSSWIDRVVREKPSVVKRTHDYFVGISVEHLSKLLEPYKFELELDYEEDGSVVASLTGFDLVVAAQTENEARKAIANELVEYAQDYFAEFDLYYRAPNRQEHFPYLLKVLLMSDASEIESLIA
jgi:antitoxin YefM